MIDIGLVLSIVSFLISSMVAWKISFESDCMGHTRLDMDEMEHSDKK
jgi:hypothetical protein